jgi:hypothetical protein
MSYYHKMTGSKLCYQKEINKIMNCKNKLNKFKLKIKSQLMSLIKNYKVYNNKMKTFKIN